MDAKRLTGFVGLLGLGALALLIPRQSWAMTDVAAQDTSDVPRAADLNPEINAPFLLDYFLPPQWPSYTPPAIPNEAQAVSYVPWEADFPVTLPYSWEADFIASGALSTNPEGDYVPWEDGFPAPAVDPAPVSQSPIELVTFERQQLQQVPNMSRNIDANFSAFLYMIRCCEHLFPQNVLTGNCYRLFYSGNADFNTPEFLNQTFSNFSDHPANTGECLPVPLPTAVCEAAGLRAGCVSSAAGAYQIIRPTWDRIRARKGLPDFSPASQDAAALALLEECGAAPFILAQNFDAAVKAASKLWASLPGATTKQGPKKMNYALDRFNEGLSRIV